MSHMKECAILTQKYLHEKGQTISIDDILLRPHHKQVWYHWLAQAHFNERNHYKTLEEAPEGLPYITVMNKTNMYYQWVGEKYVMFQEVTKEDCKAIYGD